MKWTCESVLLTLDGKLTNNLVINEPFLPAKSPPSHVSLQSQWQTNLPHMVYEHDFKLRTARRAINFNLLHFASFIAADIGREKITLIIYFHLFCRLHNFSHFQLFKRTFVDQLTSPQQSSLSALAERLIKSRH